MPRPREFDKQAVILQAMFVFWARGYEATSVRDLTSAMGISSSSLYDAIGDKHAVFLAALALYCQQEQQRMRDIAETADGPEAFVARLFTALDTVVQTDPPTQGSMAFNAMVEFGTRDAAVTLQLRRHYAEIAAIVTSAIAGWQANGGASTAHRAEDLAHMMLSTLVGIVTIASVEKTFTARDTITQLTLRLLRPDF